MGIYKLRPWTERVKLHPDVEGGNLTEAVFAIDLGAIAANDPNVPAVNRDPEAFFRATYLTADLRRLLHEVLASLAGQSGNDRVLKLRTPFGGGKSHTLASLLHAARSRPALSAIAEGADFPDPGPVAVAVFDGEKFDARDGKRLPDGRVIRTMWGWLAWQLGEDKYALVEGHDQNLQAPGGDKVQELLAGGPVLLLLDEVLKYMERAAAVTVAESTLQRQALDFFQNLTVEVANSTHAAMVYSLQWSAKEALGNIALLQALDQLASRVDQLREPVSGDDVLHIIHRRLLGAAPSAKDATAVSEAYADAVTNMRRADADTDTDREQAEEEGLIFRDRLREAYPFHPGLIDCMRDRWASVDCFQRTRGALRFIAACLHAQRTEGGAAALLGPGEVPLRSAGVRVSMLKELGAQNDYDAVISADINGPTARAKRVDERLSRDDPALASASPAVRLATAILMHSFGGLRQGNDDTEALPPGISESDLLACCVGPDLDNITARHALSLLRNACLYLHYDGVRYCFKKDPNVTKLIEDAEQEVARKPEQVRERVREMLEQRLAGCGATVWPATSQDLRDGDPTFLVAYLPLEFAGQPSDRQESHALELLSQFGSKPRRYRNGVGLAVPDKRHVEPLRRAVRYLLAIERVEGRQSQHRLTKDQTAQLRERKRTEEAAAESALRNLYSSVWLPRVEAGALALHRVEASGRPLQATSMHARVMEILKGLGAPHVHDAVTARKLMERVKLGEPIGDEGEILRGIQASDVRDAFFCFLEPPRLASDAAIRAAIVNGVREGRFAYTSGVTPTLGSDGKHQVNLTKVVINKTIGEDEVDFDSGFLMTPESLPLPDPGPGSDDGDTGDGGTGDDDPGGGGIGGGGGGGGEADPHLTEGTRAVRLRFHATRDQVFRAFQALANLADRSDDGCVAIQVDATSAEGFEPTWLRNAVEEPLNEADIELE
jgi:hypothetical protein